MPNFKGPHCSNGTISQRVVIALPSFSDQYGSYENDKRLRYAGLTISNIRIAIVSTWRGFLSLRDPTGAAHAVGPPGPIRSPRAATAPIARREKSALRRMSGDNPIRRRAALRASRN